MDPNSPSYVELFPDQSTEQSGTVVREWNASDKAPLSKVNIFGVMAYENALIGIGFIMLAIFLLLAWIVLLVVLFYPSSFGPISQNAQWVGGAIAVGLALINIVAICMAALFWGRAGEFTKKSMAIDKEEYNAMVTVGGYPRADRPPMYHYPYRVPVPPSASMPPMSSSPAMATGAPSGQLTTTTTTSTTNMGGKTRAGGYGGTYARSYGNGTGRHAVPASAPQSFWSSLFS